MLARLGNAGAWLRSRQGMNFPPSGPQYALFDLSSVVAFAPLFWYVAGSPTATSQAALSWLLAGTGLQVGGALVALGGLTGMVCSQRWEWAPVGIIAVFASALLWLCVLLVGVAVSEPLALALLALLVAGFVTVGVQPPPRQPMGWVLLWIVVAVTAGALPVVTTPLGTLLVFGFLVRRVVSISAGRLDVETHE